jgi:hypothetical protein
LASENEAKIKVFLLLFRKRRFYENRAPVEAKLLFFMFRASEKRLKIDANIDLEKNIEKNPQKSIFPSKLASPNLPKSLKMDPQSDVKRSLFSDAMDLTRKSSQSNGRHSL